ncbi:MAG: VWA domain-containing protein, partial [Acidobacteriota bacterium]
RERNRAVGCAPRARCKIVTTFVPRPALFPAIILVWIGVARAQISGEPEVPTLHSDTRVVQIAVSARDSHGRPVRGLTREDFKVTDQGKPRAIQIFGASDERDPEASSRPSAPLPANVFTNRIPPPARTGRASAILFDGVNTAFEDQAWSRLKIIDLLRTLPAKDPIALYATTPGLRILQDYTTERDLLLRSLQAFTPVPPRGLSATPSGLGDASVRHPGAPPAESPAAEGRFFMDRRVENTLATLSAIGKHMAVLPGRKAILWVTSAFPPGELRASFPDRFSKTVAALNEANVAVYPIDARGLTPAPPVEIPTMQEFAESTGGRAFYGRNDLDAAITEALEDARTTYTLGFYVSDTEMDGRFHRLKVQVARPGIGLGYRHGYLAGAGETPGQEGKNEALEASLLSPLDETAVGITAAIGISGGSLQVRLNLDPKTLSLKSAGDLSSGSLDEMFVETDQSGRVYARIADHMQFQVTPKNRAAFAGRGLTYTKSLPLAPGATRLHIVIRDALGGHTGSVTVPLQELR